VTAGQKFPQALLWMNLQTTGVSPKDDFILEAAAIVTDFDLEPITGQSEVVKLTKPAVDRIRTNDYVLKMHVADGLLKESKEATLSLAEVEKEFVTMLKTATTFEPGEFMIAGAGVAHFTAPMLRSQMPELYKWVAFYPFDTGILRRTTKILTGRDIINPVKPQYVDGVKVERALPAVRSQITEAKAYRSEFRAKF
jgi:oligoribonuclease